MQNLNSESSDFETPVHDFFRAGQDLREHGTWLWRAPSVLPSFVTVSDPTESWSCNLVVVCWCSCEAMSSPFISFAALVVLLQFVPVSCDGPSNASSPRPISFQPSDDWYAFNVQ